MEQCVDCGLLLHNNCEGCSIPSLSLKKCPTCGGKLVPCTDEQLALTPCPVEATTVLTRKGKRIAKPGAPK